MPAIQASAHPTLLRGQTPTPVPVKSPATRTATIGATSTGTSDATKAVTKKTVVNRTVANRTVANRTVANRTVASKTVTRKTVTRKTVRRSTAPVTITATSTTTTTTTVVVQVAPVPAVADPNAVASIGVPVTASVPATAPTTTVKVGPTTTLPPAPFPAPANPATRASAATIDPYRGVGMWVDRFDWTTQWSKKAVPPFTAATVDLMAANGVQTIYIQAAYWANANDILEPEKLLPIIDRAHQLGMYVVPWYLPAFQDVNTDLRKAVAIANLDVDGVDIDIEEKSVIRDVVERNRRLVQYSQNLRQVLPGRFISNDIVAPTFYDAVPNYWPDANGQIKPATSYWGGPFPYQDIAPYYDLWMIQSYWTQRSAASGWRDGYRYTVENVNRLRAALGRSDVPIHVIGGEGGKDKTLNEFGGFLQASRDLGTIGISFYDWMVTPPSWLPYFWSFRYTPVGTAPDPRFPPTALPPYAPLPQPVLLPVPTIAVPTTAAPVAPTAPPVAVPLPTIGVSG